MTHHKIFWTLYTIITWTTVYACYLKYSKVQELNQYSYKVICFPVCLISVIYFIEAYFKMIKAKICQRKQNKAE